MIEALLNSLLVAFVSSAIATLFGAAAALMLPRLKGGFRVVFDALTTEDLTRIVDIQVAALASRLAGRRLTLEVSDAAREWLAINGFDPLYGARPLRRLVQTSIGDALARELLAGQIRDGQTVVVDAREDRSGLIVTGR